MIYLYNYTNNELKEILLKENLPAFRIMQIIDGLYKSKAYEFEDITTLPKDIKTILAVKYIFFSIKCEEQQISKKTNTIKYLFRLEDGQFVETVAIPNREQQYTLCISSQVGCPLKCAFCASGLKGWVRNLTINEIVEQIMFIKKTDIAITNIVFMGIGEPFLNYENVIKAVEIINDPKLINIGARKITISTSGIFEAIDRFSEFDKQVRLSISLHFPDDALRTKYMPINEKYPLTELIKKLKNYQQRTNRLVTFEYILFKSINDNIKWADKLMNLLKGLDYKINLIPYNPVEGLDFQSPDQRKVTEFYEYLVNNNIKVTLRKRKGDDIKAACGQLRFLKTE